MECTEFNHIREAQLNSMKSEKPLDKKRFFSILKVRYSHEAHSVISAFSEEIEKQEYSHGQLSNVQYMAHPYRVALRLIEQFPAINKSYIQLALCHNIIEVSGITKDLSACLGPDLEKYVTILTVDRELQWEPAYKKIYYKQIAEQKITRIIKIFDKLDNLFILSENNDKKVKLMYLEEIENYLMPLVKLDTPNLEDCFRALIKINYELINEPK